MAKRMALPFERLKEEAFGDYAKAVESDNDFACALVIGAVLEQSMMTLLYQSLRTGETTKMLFDLKEGLIREYSACAKMLYCMGIIDNGTFANLNILSSIRNEFGHSPKIRKFSDPDILSLCQTLTMPGSGTLKIQLKQPGSNQVTSYDALNDKEFRKGLDAQTGRDRYVTVASLLNMQIYHLASQAVRPQNKYPAMLMWPIPVTNQPQKKSK
jgi:hypothetical protein